MKIIEYKLFNLLTFDSDNGDINHDDTLVALNLESFITQLRNMPIKKLDYLKYWNRPEHQNKKIIEIYDEIISNIYDLESQANKIFDEFGHGLYIIRSKDKKPNFLKAYYLDIEIEKVKNEINEQIDESLKKLDRNITDKLDNLYKRTEIVITRVAEYSRQKNLNPNLMVQNKIGYSLSDV